ncbi:Rqc2 family fibronectin-binding protein [Faecalispora anaeroviscerum]|uniref:Rqc2 family fibronectin-binding protein n=1 Tax=Faecalispora anaeroviscerum TaxID=2991836 RepID=UPI0024BAF40A|nr:NFACT RNA binding domain-containing protein [Faecalispora anaeroviscerum]
MALDGAFLRHLSQELEQAAQGARVEKIYQPNREEMVFLLRTRAEQFKLLISARANSARIHFTRSVPENPKQPPMLCMLMRKRLSGAKLLQIRQPQLERLLFLDFEAVNELGDLVRLTVVSEIMGRYSNIILIDEEGRVIDALKRVDAEMSSERLVLPGLRYELPPAQGKLCLLEVQPQKVLEGLFAQPKEMELSKGLLSVLQGVSPVVCREIQHRVGRGEQVLVHGMTDTQRERLLFFLGRLKQEVEGCSGVPHLVLGPDKKPIDFSFLRPEQYGTSAVVREHASFSELLDAFYEERDHIDRMRVREQDLFRHLTTISDRLSRKINAQRGELVQCAEREHLRVCGDLLNANLYQIEPGLSSVELENFYDESLPKLRIRLDPRLTPSQNAQKYYKDYRKARTAEEKLTEQIAQAQQELLYLDTVLEELSRAETERDLLEVRQELQEQGYLKAPKGSKQKPVAAAAPMEFTVSDEFRVLVGRNNRQNDRLTLKLANNNDIWFHTKNIPGSHTILVTDGKTPTESALLDAARLAAVHSKGKSSSQVPVDYTQVRHVHKPAGAKPGMVIYENYRTMYVTPEEEKS